MSAHQLVRNVVDEIAASNLLGRASELAFDFLFALFPLILLMLNLFGFFERSTELQNNFLSHFADFVPPIAFQLLTKTTAELAANASGRKLTFGILLTVWFASGGVTSMISALNLSYRIREARSWLRVRMAAVGLTIVIAILLLAALFVVVVSGRFVDWLGRELRLQPIVVAVWKALQWPAVMFFVTVSCSLIYFFGPDLKERHWNWITPGSAFGVLVWLASSLVFRIYLRFFNSYSTSYGSLGAVMILLVWLYVTGLAFLIGGAINAEIDRAIARCNQPTPAQSRYWTSAQKPSLPKIPFPRLSESLRSRLPKSVHRSPQKELFLSSRRQNSQDVTALPFRVPQAVFILMTMRYVHPAAEQKRVAMEKFEKFRGEAVLAELKTPLAFAADSDG